MPVYTAIIIDDEKEPRAALQKIITKYLSDKIRVIQAVESVKDGADAIKSFNPDIVFLDIEMPEENGFALFNYFNGDIDFEVIFTTAYQKFAIDAIKCSALDYLLKPISHIELKEVIEKLERKKAKENLKFKLETLITNMQSGDSVIQKIALPTSTGFEYIKVGNIVYCQADDTYTVVYTNRAEKFIVSKPLKKIEELLPKSLFHRIHKSYLVGINFIKSYNKAGGHSIVLENTQELPVAQSRSKDLIERLSSVVPE
ncbi:MAG: LytTR family DNA-binding domain-containing protein [Carboxylicivirga sp.]|jgi:two-component system LytT family response regulator|nr:LytTR family DNA-binding domain-containing protein [Carboxylicivirga sp.]